MQKPALNSAHLRRENTETNSDFNIQAAGGALKVHVCFLSPVVLLLHAAQALQASVAGVKRRLEVLADHHLLRRGVQHAQSPG